jgi:hypothetical protein
MYGAYPVFFCIVGTLRLIYFYVFLYTKVATSNVHPTHEPNELARATNEPSQAGIFARFLTSRAELARLFNKPDRAEPSRPELAGVQP